MDARVRHKARILKVLWERGDLLRGDDGYWVFWPNRNHGAYNEYDLLTIANLLREANRLWDKQIQEAFSDKFDASINPRVVKTLDTEWGPLPVIEF